MHNVTEAMVQIRERSRWARRTKQDDKDSCDHVQHTARGVVSSASSRRSRKRSSVGKVPVCKNGKQREVLKNLQNENAFGMEVIRVEKTRSDIASVTRLEFNNSTFRKREGKTGFSNSEAKYSKDTLQHANIARAELMDDVVTIQRVISVPRRR